MPLRPLKGKTMNGQTANLIRGAARFVCGELIDLLFARGAMERPTRTCRAGSENPCLPCFLDHGECVAPVTVTNEAMFPPFDGVEEAQMAARRADARPAAGFDPYLQTR
jgi:hypothetical protein